MEGFTCARLLPQLEDKIDPRQYARKGHSTLDALLYKIASSDIQYLVLGPRKSPMPLVRVFSENDKIFRQEKKYVE